MKSEKKRLEGKGGGSKMSDRNRWTERSVFVHQLQIVLLLSHSGANL